MVGIEVRKRLTLCSEGPTPITKTLPPNLTDCQSNRVSVRNCEDVFQARTYEDSRSDTALHSCTVKCKRKLHTRRALDLLRNLFGLCSLLNLYSLDSWKKLLGELKSGWEEIGDDNGRTTCSTRSKKSN